jgi:tetratricopeptide (TPR) repeat protein
LALHDENLKLCAQLDLGRQRTNSLNALATLYARKGDLARSIDYLEESLALARQIDNPDALCNACYMLAGVLVDEGCQIGRAFLLYEECLQVARCHQRPIVESMTLAALGIVSAFTGDLARAATLLPQALQMQQAMNAGMALGWTHQYLGILALLQEDACRAARDFGESLEAAPQGGAHFVVPLSLEGMAAVWGRQGQPVRGARLLGAAEALRQTLDHPHPPIECAFYNQILSSIQAQLPEDTFQRAWQQGRQLTVVQAIAEAKAPIGRHEVIRKNDV